MAEYQYPNGRIAIFAKAPVAGQVKTRMQPTLSKQQSAILQSRLISHTLTTATDSRVAPVQLWCAPDMQHAAFQGRDVELKKQTGADLGARMRAAFEKNLSHDFTILIGTDCPLLSTDDLHEAALTIQKSSVCIIPAHDGGYVLIASQQVPRCFEKINWGSEKVLSQSLSALSDSRQDAQLLSERPDLDHPEDLAQLPPKLVEQLGIEELARLARQHLLKKG